MSDQRLSVIKPQRLLAMASAALLVAAAAFVAGRGIWAAAEGGSTLTQATLVGSSSPAGLETGGTSAGDETASTSAVDSQIPHSSTVRHLPATDIPRPAGNTVVTDSVAPGFNGISHRDQRFAGTGAYTNTQFSLEPPDQGLCAGNGRVLEVVNTALQVFAADGSVLTAPTAINQFLLLRPEVIRSTPRVFGDFTSDPRCYFDTATDRWFLTVLQIDVNPSTGAFGPRSHLLIAVSRTGDPTGSWSIFSLDVTDDGQNGTPAHPSCPCFGDQPLIGADASGFFVSTNEFSLAGTAFNGAQLYAFSKAGLQDGSNLRAVHIDAGTIPAPDGGIWFTIQPATSPAAQFESANQGTEYFLSSLDFSGTLDNRVAVWALSNTHSLATGQPAVRLTHVVITSEVYGQPPNAQQRPGITPLGDSVHEPLELLAGNDDRMNQVVFAAGKLWSGVNTVVQPPNGPTRVGIAYFVVAPSTPNGHLTAVMASQGYVAVNQENVLFPSIGVNADGGAVMTFTLVGPDFFPSAAYARISTAAGSGDVHVAGAGAGPEDGFTGYRDFGGGGVARWGDYTAAVADADGSVVMATEYIPGVARTRLANWGTFVMRVSP